MLFLLRISLHFLLLFQDSAARPIKWVVSQNSSLCVNGSTNINQFSCGIPAYGQKDTLILRNSSDKGITLAGTISLKVQSFDCHNAMMTRDLRKTLKEPQFPELHINFLSLSKFPDVSTQPEPITGMVDLALAGITKRCEISYRIFTDAQKVIHLTGSRELNFTDFGLRPPTKLGGMIRTKDQLEITFQLLISVATSTVENR